MIVIEFDENNIPNDIVQEMIKQEYVSKVKSIKINLNNFIHKKYH